MRRTTFALLLAFAPAALAAQSEPGQTESKPAAPAPASGVPLGAASGPLSDARGVGSGTRACHGTQ